MHWTIALASLLSITHQVFAGLHMLQTRSETTLLDYAAGNASNCLGYQLSGIFGTLPDLSILCSSTSSWDSIASKAAATGIDTDGIKNIMCSRIGLDMLHDGATVFASLIGDFGDLFISELLAAVKDEPRNWETLCNTINPALTGVFFGPTNKLLPTVCAKAGLDGPTNPNIGSNNFPPGAADTIHAAATSLLSWQVISLFATSEAADKYCTKIVADSKPKVTAIDLDAELYESTVCRYTHERKALPSIEEIVEQYFTYGTDIFAESLWSVTDSNEFRSWLCKGHTTGKLANFVQRPHIDVGSSKSVFIDRNSAHCRDAGVAVG